MAKKTGKSQKSKEQAGKTKPPKGGGSKKTNKKK